MSFDQPAKPRHCTPGGPSVLVAQSLYRPHIAAASMENRNDHLAPGRRSETPSSILIFLQRVAQTSPPCAYCRRRPRRPHPRHLQESHQLGKATLLLSLACGTHCSACGCDPVTLRLSAAADAAAPATLRSSPLCAAPRRASADLVAGRRRRSDTSGIRGRSESAAGCA